MPWQEHASFRLDLKCAAASRLDQALFLRTTQSVYRVELGDQPTISWSYRFPSDLASGVKLVRAFPEAVVTVAYAEKRPCPARLVAFDPADGSVRWERPIAWSTIRTCGGLLSSAGKLVVLERLDQPRLLIIDPADGAVLHMTDPLQVAGVDIFHWPSGAVVVGHLLYVEWNDLGLYRIDLEHPATAPERVLEGSFSDLTHAGDALYMIAQATNEVVWLDGRSGEEQGRYLMPSDWEVQRLCPFWDAPGHVLVSLQEGYGLAALHMGDTEPLWHTALGADASAFTVVDTPYGVTFTLRAARRQLAVIDRTSGVLLNVDSGHHPYMLSWSDDYLFAGHLGGLHIFKWRSEPSEDGADRPAAAAASAQAAHAAAAPAGRTPAQQDDDAAFSAVIQAFVDGMQLAPGEAQTQALQRFNTLCNAFFASHPEADLSDIASGLTQLGVPAEQAMRDVLWARTFGSET